MAQTYAPTNNIPIGIWLVTYNNDNQSLKATHTYDSMHRRLTTKTGSAQVTYTYADDRLASIQHTGGTATKYDFTYTTGGQLQKVAIGTAFVLVQNTYNSGKWTLQKQAYPNSQSWAYSYYSNDNLYQRWTLGGTAGVEYRYFYDTAGRMARVNHYKTVLDGETVTSRTLLGREFYFYDSANRLTMFRETRSGSVHEVSWTYSANDEITNVTESVNGAVLTESHTYSDDGQETRGVYQVSGGNQWGDTLVYDSWGRLSTRTTGGTRIAEFTYRNPSSTYTSTQISRLRNTYGGSNHDLNYTYDANGNILTVDDGTNLTEYVYDMRNALTWEYNQAAGKAWNYTYDLGGNITKYVTYDCVRSGDTWTTSNGVTKTYTYGNATWGDLLTKYNGANVTSDGAGNITGFDGGTFTWQGGHRLIQSVKGGATTTYQYDEGGHCIQKKVGSTTYNYYYRGDRLMADIGPNDALYFRYDVRGEVLGFARVTSAGALNYTYVKNQQGDILAVINYNGDILATYSYDAWGNILSVGGTDSTIANRNPLRYRGYYYDSETQLYYLHTRYYVPLLRRFLSPDSYAETYDSAIGANMFAYCLNKPCMCYDVDGTYVLGFGVSGGAGMGGGANIGDIILFDGHGNTILVSTGFVGGGTPNVGVSIDFAYSMSADNVFEYIYGNTLTVGGSYLFVSVDDSVIDVNGETINSIQASIGLSLMPAELHAGKGFAKLVDVISFNNQEVPQDVDETFFSDLPKDIRQKVLKDLQLSKRKETTTSNCFITRGRTIMIK